MSREMTQQSSQKTALPLFVYSSDYNLDLGPHVFPSVKFGYIYLKLVDDPRFKEHRFLEPAPITEQEARLVHDKEYMKDLLTLNNTKRLYRSELPLNKPVVDGFFLGCGGTVMAAREALEHGSAMNLGGGFHHSFREHAEGFCYLNDTAIAIRILQKEKKVKNVLVIDLDVHQGNGTAKIFQGDDTVFTFSMHEEENYPVKEKGDLDIGLRTNCPDEEYLTLLSRALQSITERFEPELIFYLAGVDVFEHDTLGGLSLTRNGMAERDRMIRDYRPEIPMVTLLAGGYARDNEDTVGLHTQTCEVLSGIK